MRKIFLLSLMAFVFLTKANAQTVSTFDNLVPPVIGYWNGGDFSKGFQNGNASFKNSYDTTGGFNFWGGFAYTNHKDTVNGDYTNEFSSIVGSGYNSSKIYAVGYDDGNAVIRLTGAAAGKSVLGFYITNTTWAYKSMKNGDANAKKFGGTSGNDTDYFKVVVHFFYAGTNGGKTAEFYLADFRFADNSKDYIVKTWQWFDLTSLGPVDSLAFEMISTDTGAFGINTPVYFCMDNFTTADAIVGIRKLPLPSFELYPNPATDVLNIKGDVSENGVVKIFNTSGQLVLTSSVSASSGLDISSLKQGVYFANIEDYGSVVMKKFVKM